MRNLTLHLVGLMRALVYTMLTANGFGSVMVKCYLQFTVNIVFTTDLCLEHVCLENVYVRKYYGKRLLEMSLEPSLPIQYGGEIRVDCHQYLPAS